uniref:Uncharacterized protein n=1 Tax=Chromera velia CCMP2878 TaxID=1169474 RepID=A0A0G4FRZ5_9ALVE|eukprot:Cvel_3677.t1-p1 / transcript=Cvel_3677.t1 / gene=Cvel_3677 / organism=Chromera_velia_CCMP2878 / gene_product=hypothetical protein / transcript_product=hypothetical protein / location=Cvel_scaffold152:122578-123101(-) / protein_length=139 / sequence_SO=supercontig / SO=protein_coding / is_pseudo=false
MPLQGPWKASAVQFWNLLVRFFVTIKGTRALPRHLLVSQICSDYTNSALEKLPFGVSTPKRESEKGYPVEETESSYKKRMTTGRYRCERDPDCYFSEVDKKCRSAIIPEGSTHYFGTVGTLSVGDKLKYRSAAMFGTKD